MNVITAVDISYSMGGYINKVVDGLNNFLLKLKKLSDRQLVYLTIITFSTDVNYVVKSVNVNMIEKFHPFQFNCYGMTSMYDAIGQIILD